MPRDLWRVSVDLTEVADLTGDGALAQLGIESLSPTRGQWKQTQPIGEECWRAGRQALLAPSAAHAGGLVLAVFRTAPAPIGGLTPIRPTRRYSELPPLPTGLRT